MKYLNVRSSGFGFNDERINDSDIEISDIIYETFFSLQGQGKSFKIKDPSGELFEDIFEEYNPEQTSYPKTQAEEIAELKQLVADLAALQLGV